MSLITYCQRELLMQKKREELEKQRFYKLEEEASVFHNIKLDKDNKKRYYKK